MQNNPKVEALMQAAYDSGYYSGKGEDGQPHHYQAMNLRNICANDLTRQIDTLVKFVQMVEAFFANDSSGAAQYMNEQARLALERTGHRPWGEG